MRGYHSAGVNVMTLHLHVPPEIEALLKRVSQDPSAEIFASAMVDLHRRKLLSQRQLGEALGLNRFEVDALLKKHGVFLEFDPAEIDAEATRILKDVQLQRELAHANRP